MSLVLGSDSYYFYFTLSYTSYLVPILNIFIGSNNERALLNLFRLSRRYLLMKLLSWICYGLVDLFSCTKLNGICGGLDFV